jgi:pteridine reductase
LIELTDTVALITGAAKRLGRATAQALAAAGAGVVVHYRSSSEEADGLAQELTNAGARAWTVQADLANPDEASALFRRAMDIAGRVDYVVNNASIFHESNVLDFTPEDLASNLQIHALAPLALARAQAAAGSPGAIVHFLDTRVFDYDRKHAAYHLSKRMLFTLTRMLANELAPLIRVNAVAPGLVLPPVGKDQNYLDSLAHTNPMNTHGSAEDVAEAVVFLLRSDFITGQVIFVDGGRHMAGHMYG